MNNLWCTVSRYALKTPTKVEKDHNLTPVLLSAIYEKIYYIYCEANY